MEEEHAMNKGLDLGVRAGGFKSNGGGARL